MRMESRKKFNIDIQTIGADYIRRLKNKKKIELKMDFCYFCKLLGPKLFILRIYTRSHHQGDA